MARKQPPNGTATQFKSGEEAARNGRKGGIASGKSKRARKTVQAILADYLDGDARGSAPFVKLANALGVEDGTTIKEVIVMKYLVNTIKEGDLSDLERLMKLLGEQKETSGAEEKLDALLKEMDNAVKSEAT